MARRVRGVLVVGQVALALVLLIGAGLMIRSVRHLSEVDPGFDPSSLLTAQIDLPSARYPEGRQQVAFFEALVERVRQLPGVGDAGVFNFLPLTGLAAATSFSVVGLPPPPAAERPVADVRIVDERALGTMRIGLLQGRGFTDRDTAEAPLVVVINETMARQFWPAGDAIGQRVQVNWDDGDEAEIVGVVRDVRHFGLDLAVRPMVFFAERQSPFDLMTLVVRTESDPMALAGAVRGAVRELDPELALQRVRPMEEIVTQSMAERRFSMVMLTAFSVLALLLTAIGIYGLLASLVGQRLREIGIRIALGAERRDVVRLVAGRGLVLTVTGVIIGTAGALVATRLMASLLFGVTATDPTTFVVLPVVLTVVAALATWLPVRRAMRVDPAVVLRDE